MKTIRTTLTAALSALMIMATYSNTAAQENKKGKNVIELSESEFNKKVYDTAVMDGKYLGELPAIVDFTAVWCGPCKKTAPILEEVATEYAGRIAVYKVDVDKCRKIAEAMGISSIPAILYIPLGDDKPVMTVGARGKERFKAEISEYLLK